LELNNDERPVARVTASGSEDIGNGQRKQPVQARSVARVERILDAAASVIAEVGVASATTTGIAQRAGITLASLYRYFPNKTAVIRAVAERQLRRLDAHFEEFLVDLD